MFRQADMLENGKGVPVDLPQAIRLYRMAAEMGHIRSIGYLGWLLFQGKGVPYDRLNGLKVMESAAKAGDHDSMARMLYLKLMADAAGSSPFPFGVG
jgi:TPR repeat protein